MARLLVFALIVLSGCATPRLTRWTHDAHGTAVMQDASRSEGVSHGWITGPAAPQLRSDLAECYWDTIRPGPMTDQWVRALGRCMINKGWNAVEE